MKTKWKRNKVKIVFQSDTGQASTQGASRTSPSSRGGRALRPSLGDPRAAGKEVVGRRFLCFQEELFFLRSRSCFNVFFQKTWFIQELARFDSRKFMKRGVSILSRSQNPSFVPMKRCSWMKRSLESLKFAEWLSWWWVVLSALFQPWFCMAVGLGACTFLKSNSNSKMLNWSTSPCLVLQKKKNRNDNVLSSFETSCDFSETFEAALAAENRERLRRAAQPRDVPMELGANGLAGLRWRWKKKERRWRDGKEMRGEKGEKAKFAKREKRFLGVQFDSFDLLSKRSFCQFQQQSKNWRVFSLKVSQLEKTFSEKPFESRRSTRSTFEANAYAVDQQIEKLLAIRQRAQVGWQQTGKLKRWFSKESVRRMPWPV